MENKVVNLEVKDNLGSLKSQLRQAQAEVAALSDKFGATSREAVIAAQKAAVLADKIGDAKALTEAFNPDAKFKSLSASLSGVAGGFAAYQGALGLVGVESKELEQQLLRVQSAMAIAEGLQGLGEAQDSFKQLKAVGVNAFNSIKTAIGSTGIGLIVVAAGAIYAYWDDIKGAVSGVSEEQKKLNGLSQENADQEAEKLKNLNNQDNVLKLQGKSEKEILNIKIKATNEAISAAKINIKNQEVTNALSVEGAKRNYEYLKSFIDFISIPQRMIFETGAKAINKMIDLINKIPGVEIKGKIDETFANKASDYITKLGFDPEKTKSKGDATIKAAKESLDKMVNDRAGMQLAINEIDKKATEDKQKAADEAKQKAEQKAEQDEKERQALIRSQGERARDEYEAAEKLIKDTKKANEDALKTENQLKVDKENAEFEAKKANLLSKGLSIEEIEKEHKRNLAKLDDEYFASEADKAIKSTADAKAQSDAKIAIAQKEKEARIQAADAAANTLSGLSELLGKETAAGKAAAVASATINTFSSAQKAYDSTVGIPFVGPVLAPINAGIAIAAGIKNVKSILAVKTPNGGGGGSAPSGGGTGSGAVTAPSFNVVGASATNQLAQTIAGQQQQPVKAYVVANDVTTQQSLDRNIVQSATIG